MERNRVASVLARFEPAHNGRALGALENREPAGLPPLPEDQALIAEAAKAAGLGPWVRYGASSDCMYCSPEAASVFGVEPGEDGTTFLEFWSLIHPDHRGRVAEVMESTRRNPRPYGVEYAIVLPSGETRYVAETAQPYFDEAGRLTHFLGAFQDITERRHPDGGPDMEDLDRGFADAEHRRSRRLDAFSDEIKALLDIVISSSELMLWQQEGELPETYRGYTRDIRRSGMDLKLIFEDLLAGMESRRRAEESEQDGNR